MVAYSFSIHMDLYAISPDDSSYSRVESRGAQSPVIQPVSVVLRSRMGINAES